MIRILFVAWILWYKGDGDEWIVKQSFSGTREASDCQDEMLRLRQQNPIVNYLCAPITFDPRGPVRLPPRRV